MSKDDLLQSNRDLLDKAGEILARGTPRKFDARVIDKTDTTASIELITMNIPEIDIYVNDRPEGKVTLVDGSNTVNVQIPSDVNGESILRFEGFENGRLVGARQLTV